MKLKARLPTILLILNLLVAAASASASTPDFSWICSLKTVAYSLGWIMMVIMGIKWIIADSPNERADAKKGMIYIVIGLLVVKSAVQLIQLYCDNVAKAGITITCNTAQFSC